MRRGSPTVVLRLAVLVLVTSGCTDSTDPTPTSTGDDGQVLFGGSLDPGQQTFVLERIAQPGPRPFFIELVGSHLEVDAADETIALDVALRNVGREPLAAPASVWVGRFRPDSVTVINPDIRTATKSEPPPRLALGFDYSDLLGEDGVLSPQELSGAKSWIFYDPGLSAFSFEAEARFSVGPEPTMLTGLLFLDRDANGRYDPGDDPYVFGHVEIDGPEEFHVATRSGEDGRYGIEVKSAGLYTVTFDPRLDGPVPCFTTPNPLQVLLPPDPDGGPTSFYHADVGLCPGPCPPLDLQVVMTDVDPDQIEQDAYVLGEAELIGDRLRCTVGFSGCQPEHPFTLFISRRFTESSPVQTWALLAHDDLGEECAAAFSRTLEFDLMPLRQAYLEAFGEPGIVELHLRDFAGNETRFLFGP